MANHYRKLKVWQQAFALVTEVYKVTAPFPKEETYGLISQIRRCAVSLPSNIAEGAARETPKEFLRFIHIANGSLAELDTQFLIAGNLGYCTQEIVIPLENHFSEIGKMLYGLKKNLEEKLLTTNDSLLVTTL